MPQGPFIAGDVDQSLLFALLHHLEGFLLFQFSPGSAFYRIVGRLVDLNADLNGFAAFSVYSPAGAGGDRQVSGLGDNALDIVEGQDLSLVLDGRIDRDHADHRGGQHLL